MQNQRGQNLIKIGSFAELQSIVIVMDNLYEIFLHYANYYASMQMFPYLQCVHFTIMTLKLRAETGELVIL